MPRRSTASTGRRRRMRWRNSCATATLQRDARDRAKLLRHHDRRGADAVDARPDLVQRHAAPGDGGDRRRRRQGDHHARLVSHRARQVPASGHRRHSRSASSASSRRSIRTDAPCASSGKPLVWGGATTLCTREIKFEINEHGDCAARGFASAGFGEVNLAGRRRQDAAAEDAMTDRTRAPLRPCRHLGVRPRQHALSASHQSVAAGRRAHPRLCRAFLKMPPDEAYAVQKDSTSATAPRCAA